MTRESGKFQKRTVVITGASTGIGEACAIRLAKKGVSVFAGVRRESDGEALRSKAPEGLTPVILGVTDQESVERALEVVRGSVEDRGVWGLVNNAGIPLGGPLEFLPLDKFQELFDVNVTGVLRVTQAFLPLIRRCRGRIVNISSISGRIASPFVGPYAATKFALEAISDAWRVELRPWGIRVSIVEPGKVLTPIWDKTRKILDELIQSCPEETRELYGEIFGLSEKLGHGGIPVDRVAKAVEHALINKRPKIRYLLGADAKVGALVAKLPARLRDWALSSHLPKYGPKED
jgi:NAD(P)-dependent dehydrogenase (short-subunit alcohol dehydrogenase family)